MRDIAILAGAIFAARLAWCTAPIAARILAKGLGYPFPEDRP